MRSPKITSWNCQGRPPFHVPILGDRSRSIQGRGCRKARNTRDPATIPDRETRAQASVQRHVQSLLSCMPAKTLLVRPPGTLAECLFFTPRHIPRIHAASRPCSAGVVIHPSRREAPSRIAWREPFRLPRHDEPDRVATSTHLPTQWLPIANAIIIDTKGETLPVRYRGFMRVHALSARGV